ncbi:TAXI family TRAP transporter solute-binding subunit [Sulfurovum sp. bin170]|uniref:TAXI family TRAP transporter solute-binding subunit n=1 Tax=Sulfurovum sp. bin170 TaxID=2695268 RepID=UPI0013DF6C25|nr:TAXI family TRAP transporter solute-binding subunit [Sulfurovum sp. bin170]NEW60870.1 TAXI family TRAP transporter solute-binding subunit [Sulfurovum sp. bin170]
MSDFFKIWLPIVLLIIISFFLTYRFTVEAPRKDLTIATGRVDGAYYKYALQYKELLKQDGINLEIVTTAGSVEALALLNEKKVDFAFIQGGTVDNHSKKNLYALASVYYEPIWIFYKGETEAYLSNLKGKRIAIGEEGSGVRPVALELLGLNGIDSNNTNFYNYSTKKSINALKRGDIDLFFAVASPKSKMISKLLEDREIKLMDIKRAKAYRQVYLYYTVLTLGEGMISLEENIPPKDVQLLSKTAFLVIQGDLPDELARLILRKAKIVHSKKGVFEETNEFPNQLNLEIPISEDAKRYLENGDSFLERILPYWLFQNIDRFKLLIIPMLTLLLPFFKGALPLFRWRTRRKIYKWYKKVNELDYGIVRLDSKALDSRLDELKELSRQIKEETNVPLSYMGEYYDLRMHIDMVISQIERQLK